MQITKEEREAVYKTIHGRRDVRREYLPETIPADVLERLLNAAHHAPSVGFSQPWDFVIVRDRAVRGQIKDAFLAAHQKAAEMFEGERRAQYQRFKLEGIMEAPMGICVTCDRRRNGPVVIGRTAIPEMDLYSAVCAVQNLWLAARAENLGMGWVSIIDNETLRTILGIPEGVVPIAYLCLGYVSEFHDAPELETAGWLQREPIERLIHYERW